MLYSVVGDGAYRFRPAFVQNIATNWPFEADRPRAGDPCVDPSSSGHCAVASGSFPPLCDQRNPEQKGRLTKTKKAGGPFLGCPKGLLNDYVLWCGKRRTRWRTWKSEARGWGPPAAAPRAVAADGNRGRRGGRSPPSVVKLSKGSFVVGTMKDLRKALDSTGAMLP